MHWSSRLNAQSKPCSRQHAGEGGHPSAANPKVSKHESASSHPWRRCKPCEGAQPSLRLAPCHGHESITFILFRYFRVAVPGFPRLLNTRSKPCLSGWHTRVRTSHFAGPYTGKARRVSRRSLVMACARKLRSDSFKVSKRHQQDRRALVCQPDKHGLNILFLSFVGPSLCLIRGFLKAQRTWRICK